MGQLRGLEAFRPNALEVHKYFGQRPGGPKSCKAKGPEA